MKITPPEQMTDDTTLDDLYEQQRINALPEHLQQLVLTHAIDQFDAVSSYVRRFVPNDETEADTAR